MSSELKVDRLDKAFSERSDAYMALVDLVAKDAGGRASEIMILAEQYGRRCAEVVEANVAYLLKG